MKKNFLFLLLSVCFLATGETITVLNTTDLHGNFDNTHGGKTGTIPIVCSMLEKTAGKIGRRNLLLIDCGDILQGSRISSACNGALGVAFFNKMQYDAWIPGNHDFEFGRETLIRRVNEFKGDLLCANLQCPGLRMTPWKIFMKKGYKIAVIGLTNHHTPEWLFRPELDDLHFIEAHTALAKVIPEVMKSRPDCIILAIHAGRFIGKRFNDPYNMFRLLSSYPQIDLVLGGHSHEIITGEKLSPERPTWYVQAGAQAAGYIRADISFDAARKPHIQTAFIKADPNENSNFAQKEILQIRKDGEKVLCSQTGAIGGRHKFETAKYFADAIKKALPRHEIIFHGVLSKFTKGPGPITVNQVFRMCPFENTAITAMISPEECRAILLEQQQTKSKSGMFQYAFGVKLEGKVLRLDNGMIWDSGRKPAVFNSYAASGAGSRFPELMKILMKPDVRAADTHLRIRDLLEKYFKENCK